MTAKEERMVGENVRLRSKLARAIEAETAIRAERRALARRVRGYVREVLELETTIGELRGRIDADAKERTRIKKYETMMIKLVERVQKDKNK